MAITYSSFILKYPKLAPIPSTTFDYFLTDVVCLTPPGLSACQSNYWQELQMLVRLLGGGKLSPYAQFATSPCCYAPEDVEDLLSWAIAESANFREVALMAPTRPLPARSGVRGVSDRLFTTH